MRGLAFSAVFALALSLGCGSPGGVAQPPEASGAGGGGLGGAEAGGTGGGASRDGNGLPGAAGGGGSAAVASAVGPFAGLYQLVAKHSGMVLSVADGTSQAGANLLQSEASDGEHQRWGIVDDGAGAFELIAWNSNHCASESGTGDAVQLVCYEAMGHKWRMEQAGDGYTMVINTASGNCLQVAQGASGSGAKVNLAACEGSEQQQWALRSVESTSGNPIIRTLFTADPTVRVWEDGKAWLYPSHDPDNAKGWHMVDYHVFSSSDLITWRDHGVALHVDDISWGDPYLYAPDCQYRDGKYYLYFPTKTSAIGVAVSDKPQGPFVDALGKPLIDRQLASGVKHVFDPGVLIDDDGRVYMAFGGGGPDHARMVELGADMISLAGPIQPMPGLNHFFEAAWLHKHEGTYYFSYSGRVRDEAAGKTYTTIEYATADAPMGPYAYRGRILDTVPHWTNHHSIVEYHGQWYLFYHIGDGSSFTRRVSVDYLQYGADGSIELVQRTAEGVQPVLPQ